LSGGKGETSVAACFISGFDKMRSLFLLMFIPFILDFVNHIGFIFSGLPFYSIGVVFSTPISFPSITYFYNFPVYYPGLLPFSLNISSPIAPIELGAFLALLPPIAFSLVINSFLTGGFLGAIWEVASGSEERKGFSYYAFKRFFSILELRIIVIVISLILITPAFGLLYYTGSSFEASILLLLTILFVGYIFCLAPFIIVVENKNAIDSIRKGIHVAFTSRTTKYVVLYLIISSSFSFVIYLLMNNLFVGALAGFFIAAFAGTALVASTMDLYVSYQPLEGM
jgi:hypothetical protein